MKSRIAYSRAYRWSLALAATALSASVAGAQPANDLCVNAVAVIPGGSTTGSNAGATSDIAESSCAFGDSLDVWFRLTAGPAGGSYVVDTEGSTELDDTTLSVYDTCGGTELACNDDGGTGFLSSILVALTANQSVLIRVAGYDGAAGEFQLNVSGTLLTGGADLCPAATVVTPGNTYQGDNTGATSDVASTSCAFTPTDNLDVWFSFTPPTTAFYLITTDGSSDLDDTTLSIWSACGGSQLFCDDDGGQGLLSRLNILLNAGVNYRIRVAGWDGGFGQFLLSIGNPVPVPPAPSNDHCASATAIAALPFASSIDISGASDDADLAGCNDPAAVVTPQGVWYAYTPSANHRIRVVENSVLFTFLSVFTSSGGCAGPFTDVPDTCGFNVLLDVTAGTTYYILVGAAGVSGLPPPAMIQLTVEDRPGPPNDRCSAAVPILPGSSTTGSNVNALGTDITSYAFGDAGGVWYALSITAPGTYQIDTLGTVDLADTTLAVFGSCGGMEVGCDDDSAGDLLSLLRPILSAGTYFVRVAGYGGGEGAFQLNVSNLIPAPPNDACSTATAITTVPSSVMGTTLGATSDVASTSCAFTPTDNIDVWYSFTPGTTGYFLFDTEGSTALTDTTLSAFSACGGAEIGCDDDNGTGLLSRLNISLNSGATYFIRVSGWNHAVGAFRLNVGIGAPPPAGDTCANAVVVTSPSSTQGDTSTFTSDLAGSSCSFGDDIDAWFSFTPSTSATYTIDTLGSTGLLDTTLSIFSPCAGAELFCNDDIDLAGDNLLSSIDAALNAGSTYFIRVSGFFGDIGAFQLNIAGGGGPASGACCSGTICSVTAVSGCTGANTTFAGGGTVCNVPDNLTTPCCKSDFNHNGTISVQDLFDFLTAYFNAAPTADINGGGVTVEDIFQFLAGYFGGCP